MDSPVQLTVAIKYDRYLKIRRSIQKYFSTQEFLTTSADLMNELRVFLGTKLQIDSRNEHDKMIRPEFE